MVDIQFYDEISAIPDDWKPPPPSDITKDVVVSRITTKRRKVRWFKIYCEGRSQPPQQHSTS